MGEVAMSRSAASQGFAMSQSSSMAPPAPFAQTIGTGVLAFDTVKKYLSDRPLRIRVYEDPMVAEEVYRLVDRWNENRPRGADIEEMIGAPEYQQIIKLGKLAIRPILLRLKRKPDHWFCALQKITGANPVPPESEGCIAEMVEAWIKWGEERGYIRELD